MRYRAKSPCRVGGAFRRVGEEFEGPEFKPCPAHLEPTTVEVTAAGAASSGKVAGRRPAKPEGRPKKNPGKEDSNSQGRKSGETRRTPAGPGIEEMGLGEAKSVGDVTSSDVVKG